LKSDPEKRTLPGMGGEIHDWLHDSAGLPVSVVFIGIVVILVVHWILRKLDEW
jgi:hypothetical protein